LQFHDFRERGGDEGEEGREIIIIIIIIITDNEAYS